MSPAYKSKGATVKCVSNKSETARLGDSLVERKTVVLDSLQTYSGIIITNKEHRIEWVNASFTRITGYALEEVRGQTPRLLHGGSTDPKAVEHMRQCLARGEGFVEDVLNYRKNGDPYWARVEVSPFGKDVNEPDGFLGIHSDISQVKSDYLQLSNFRTAVEESPSTIVITDVDGIIRYVNPAFERSTGFSASEAIGQHTRMLKSGLQDSVYYKQMWIDLKKNKRWEGVFQNKRKDRQLYWEYASISEVKDEHGEPIGYIAIKQDITRQKQSEQALVRLNTELNHTTQYAEKMARRAQNASEAKSNYLAEMSHEIRTPMNGILGLAELLADSDLDPEQRQYLDAIRASGEGLLELINNILDLSKIEAGRFELVESDFSLEVVIQKAVETLRANARRKGLNLVHIKSDALPDRVRGEPRCLRQVLVNLIGNAIKFTARGDIAIIVELESLHSYQNQFRFAVRDGGIGISAQDQSKLFTKFSQVNHDHCEHIGGTGLGLAICKELVERMGGTLGVRSPLNPSVTPPQQGAGTEFWFTLPLSLAKQERASGASAVGTEAKLTKNHTNGVIEKVPANKMKKLLIVEDNATNRLVAELMLKKLGYPSESVENGRDALMRLREEQFDLVLMDIQMPIMDGLEATRLLRASEDFATSKMVPIVAMTAHALSRDRDNCLRAGMNAFLPKPVAREKLAKTLKQLLAEH
jgi:two-component system sensor histidine kinase/response regulator